MSASAPSGHDRDAPAEGAEARLPGMRSLRAGDARRQICMALPVERQRPRFPLPTEGGGLIHALDSLGGVG
jgi:hypothetical protein